MTQIGTVEILDMGAPRVYPLDYRNHDRLRTEALVEPGEYPLHMEDRLRYWLMGGVINLGQHRKIDSGLFTLGGGDKHSGIPVLFPSYLYGHEEWELLLKDPTATEGHPDQRIRITVS